METKDLDPMLELPLSQLSDQPLQFSQPSPLHTPLQDEVGFSK